MDEVLGFGEQESNWKDALWAQLFIASQYIATRTQKCLVLFSWSRLCVSPRLSLTAADFPWFTGALALHWRTGQIPLDAKVGIRKDLVELEGLS